jgi:hypothetical protein
MVYNTTLLNKTIYLENRDNKKRDYQVSIIQMNMI